MLALDPSFGDRVCWMVVFSAVWVSMEGNEAAAGCVQFTDGHSCNHVHLQR